LGAAYTADSRTISTISRFFQRGNLLSMGTDLPC
jgi:hypothetical protein